MTSVPISNEVRSNLQRLNVGAAILHGVQAIIVIVAANDFKLPVTTFFLNDAPGKGLDPTRLTQQFDVRIAWGIFGFLALSSARPTSPSCRRVAIDSDGSSTRCRPPS